MCTAVLHNIPTGCKRIDEILEGGIQNRKVSLVYGEAETGKTTLAMQCAVNCARRNYKTLFVDCDGTFSARRLSQIASTDFGSISKLIMLIRPKNFTVQKTILDQLTNYLTKNFGLIVIDTVTCLYRAEIAEYPEKTFELNREMNRQMAYLAQIAKTQKITVLVTSQVRTLFNGTLLNIEPVATRVLKFWADIIIAMKPTNNSQIIKVTLEKSSRKVRSPTCRLKIGKTGIH